MRVRDLNNIRIVGSGWRQAMPVIGIKWNAKLELSQREGNIRCREYRFMEYSLKRHVRLVEPAEGETIARAGGLGIALIPKKNRSAAVRLARD